MTRKKSFIMSSQSTNKVVIMEKLSGAQSDQYPLKCPRCDSCNTKFCYYNNYSLSQPRHFCKACKRYWTRGGTLRKVPVGGGCRKNKRVIKRVLPPSNCGGDGISYAATATIKPSVQQPDLTNPLFYTNPLELNFPFSGFNTARVSPKTAGFDHQAQMINGVGVRFSSGLIVSENYKNRFKKIQDVITTTSSSSLVSDNINPNLFGSSTNFSPNSTMSSLLASSNLGLKDTQLATDEFPGLMHYGDLQLPGENGVIIGKETKIGEENGFGLNPTQIEQMNSTDHSSLLWTTTNPGSWFDPSDMGSSVPSQI